MNGACTASGDCPLPPAEDYCTAGTATPTAPTVINSLATTSVYVGLAREVMDQDLQRNAL